MLRVSAFGRRTKGERLQSGAADTLMRLRVAFCTECILEADVSLA